MYPFDGDFRIPFTLDGLQITFMWVLKLDYDKLTYEYNLCSDFHKV